MYFFLLPCFLPVESLRQISMKERICNYLRGAFARANTMGKIRRIVAETEKMLGDETNDTFRDS